VSQLILAERAEEVRRGVRSERGAKRSRAIAPHDEGIDLEIVSTPLRIVVRPVLEEVGYVVATFRHPPLVRFCALAHRRADTRRQRPDPLQSQHFGT